MKSVNKQKLILLVSLAFSTLLFNNCTPFRFEGFHTVTATDFNLGSSLGKPLYETHCASCHGAFDSSSVKNKSLSEIQWALDNVSAMRTLSLTPTDIQAIASALNPPMGPGSRFQYACETDSVSRTDIQRLSGREYKNTVRDLLARVNPAIINDSELQGLLAEVPTDVQQGKEITLLIQKPHIESYFNVAYKIGSLIANNSSYRQSLPGASGNCLNQTTITSACSTQVVRDFGLLAFRRPLTSEEVTRYNGYFQDSASASTNEEKIIQGIATLLMAPDFNYRIPDQGTLAQPNLLRITAYEMASKISYLITGSMPDATLFARAQDGSLMTPAGREAEVLRLVNSPAAKEMFQRFFKEWMHYDRFETFNYSSAFLNGLSTAGLTTSMVQEIDEVLGTVLVDGNGTFEDLMTTGQSYVTNANLAAIYGITNTSGPVTLSSQRQGILSRAAFLTKKGGNNTSPIKRGLFILEDVLCQGVGSPPPDAPTNLEPLPPGVFLTTRDRVTHATQTAGTSCVACHGRINPLGYAFEGFDSIGRFRTSEFLFAADGSYTGVSLPVNSVTETNQIHDRNVSIRDVADLQREISDSDRALACMTKKWLTFTTRRLPTNVDGCYMNEILNTVYGGQNGQGSLKEMVKQTVISPKFEFWRY